jgi:murein DD-endopeptidase MepM/ murein hydrolase activator NlpD
MLSLLFELSAFTLWTTLLTVVLIFAQRRSPTLISWPAFYWWLLLLATVPMWPLWQWPVAMQLPNTFWLDATEQVGQLTVTAQHPSLIDRQPLEVLWKTLFAVIVLGACWQWLRLARQYWQLFRLYQQAQPVCPSALFDHDLSQHDPLNPDQAQPNQSLPELDPRLSKMKIRQHGLAISPFIFGGRQAVLMLPAYYWQFSNQQRALLLDHELQHWRRRDPWQLLCWRIIIATAWFNPALRYLEKCFCRSMELTVDRHVLAAQPQQALLYGQTLISSLKLCQQQTTPGFAHFIQAKNDSGYRHRLAALFQPKSHNLRLPLWLPLMVLSLAILLNIGFSALQGQTALPDKWQLPVKQAQVNSAFGAVSAVRQDRPHQGIDFAGSTGDPVYASHDGRVVIANNHSLNSRYGNTILLDHGHGYQTLYAHLDSFSVQPGTRVHAGQQIGAVGSSGFVTGPHLHFELLHKGQQLDPTQKLQWTP